VSWRTFSRRELDSELLLQGVQFASKGRGVYVRLSGGQQFRVDAEGLTEPQSVTDKQLAFIDRLCDEKQVIRPDGPLSKAQASEIIDSLQAGTYDPGKWSVPF